jgi:ribonuclease HI
METSKPKRKKPVRKLDEVPSTSLMNSKLLLNSFYEPDHSLISTKDGFRVNSAGFTVVYTDGSCLGNGTDGAKAAVGVYFAADSPYNVSKPLPSQYRKSNNAAEIVASIEAFKLCLQHNRKLVELRTDSKFLIGCVLEHLQKWKNNGWLKTNKKPVSNKEELEELDQALKGLTIRWVYVPGHSNETGNEYADFLARLATFKMMRKEDPLYFQP